MSAPAGRRKMTLHDALPGLRRVLVRLWPYMRSQRPLIVTSTAALLISIAFRLLEPWPLKLVFDTISQSHGKRTAWLSNLLHLHDSSPGKVILVATIAAALITTIRALADYANAVGFAKIGNRVLTDVRNYLYAHMQQLSLSFHNTARSGDLIVRVISDVNMLRDVAVTALLPLAASFLILAGMWGVMFYLHWELTVLALTIVPLMWIRTISLSKRIQETARAQRQKQGEMAATAAESLGSMKLVQALSLEPVFAAAFNSRSEKTQRQDVKGARLAANLGSTVDILLAVATSLVLWYGARLVLVSHELSSGDLVVYLMYLRRAFNPVQDFAKYTARIAKGTAAGERVIDLLDRAPEIHDLPHAKPAPSFLGDVRFEDVGFAYDAGHPVLDHVTFEVPPGRRVAIVGPSGAGKSTLVGLVLRLYDVSAGKITIDGVDLRDYTLASLRRQISTVLQESLLFAATIRENIAYGWDGLTDADIESAARLANIHDFITTLPKGYDTLVGERGVTLSGGQRQRIAIARAAVRKAPILILDEPSTGLDEENDRLVMEALERLAVGRTTFVIAHDLRVAARADTIVYVEERRVQEIGTHAQLLRAGGRYAALYGMQVSGGNEGNADTDAIYPRAAAASS